MSEIIKTNVSQGEEPEKKPSPLTEKVSSKDFLKKYGIDSPITVSDRERALFKYLDNLGMASILILDDLVLPKITVGKEVSQVMWGGGN